MAEIITPDGITEEGRKLVKERIGSRYTPEGVKEIIDKIDSMRNALMKNSALTKITDALKRSIPLMSSTSEKISANLKELFSNTLPEDKDNLLAKIDEIRDKYIQKG